MRQGLRRDIRLLKVYAVGSTLALVGLGTASCQGASAGRTAFDEIDVHRINVVGSDGGLRLVIANEDRQADTTILGEPLGQPRDRPAGMIFFNEEGTEVGGLVFGGRKDGDVVRANAGMTFDRYNQDQTVQIHYSEFGDQYAAGVRVIDRPVTSLAVIGDLVDDLQAAQSGAERAEVQKEMVARMGLSAERVFVGRRPDGSGALVLGDSQSRPRLIMAVEGDGTARIQFLDENGDVTREFTP